MHEVGTVRQFRSFLIEETTDGFCLPNNLFEIDIVVNIIVSVVDIIVTSSLLISQFVIREPTPQSPQ